MGIDPTNHTDEKEYQCPRGRICSAATGAEHFQDIAKCDNNPVKNCRVGNLCPSNYYCPRKSHDKQPCPYGRVSDPGSYNIVQCLRSEVNWD